MELALTFGAVGDFLALTLLIKDIIASLDDCRGSSKDYQSLVCSLGILSDALTEVHRVCCDSRRVSAHSALCHTALKSINQIQESLTSFNEKLKKYKSSLGPGGSGNRIKDVARRIQFKLDEKEMEKFKAEISGYTIALKMLLETMTLLAIERNHDATIKQFEGVTDQSQTLTRQIQTSHRSIKNYVVDLGRQVIGRIQALAQTTADIKRSTSQIATAVLSISLDLSSFRLLLMNPERPFTDEYFTLEDALGRQFPIHMRTITSWDAFDFVLSEKFKGGPGASRVRNGRYILTDSATKREVNRAGVWERTCLPHRKVVMSLLCRDNQPQVGDDRLTTCPWCKTPSDSEATEQIQCLNCNMFYTRVVELDDIVLPQLPTNREAPQFGQTSFNVQLPPSMERRNERKRKRNSETTASCSRPADARQIKRPRHIVNRKRKATDDEEADSDVSSDDEDVSGLVRITLISKRKKIKLFESFSSRSGVNSSNTNSIATVSAGLDFLEMLRQSQGSTDRVEIPGSTTPNDEGVFGNPYTQKDTTNVQSLFGRPQPRGGICSERNAPTEESVPYPFGRTKPRRGIHLESYTARSDGYYYSHSRYVEPSTLAEESARYLYGRSKPRRYEYTPGPSEDSGDETIEVDGVVYMIPSGKESPVAYLYGDTSPAVVPDEDVKGQTPARSATDAASGNETPEPAPLQKSRAASESDAKKHGIPAGYSLKHWDPTSKPLFLLGSVFDSNALGKWIYDWSVYVHGSGNPITEMAGDLWLLMIQLCGKVERSEVAAAFVTQLDDQETLEDFIESGCRLHDKLQKLLKACEVQLPALQQAKKEGGRLGKNAGIEFLNALFILEAERTDRFMRYVRLFNLRFDANCNEILDKSCPSPVAT